MSTRHSKSLKGLLPVMVLVLAFITPVRSWSQEVDETVMNLAQAAASLSNAGDFEGAVKLYLKAYELSKAPLLLYNAARVRDKNGDLSRARELYERYLRLEKDPKGLKRGRARLSDLLDRIPGRLIVTAAPGDATVEADGRKVSVAGPHELKRGTYIVVVKRKGYVTERREAEIRAGEETLIDVSLKPLPGSHVVHETPHQQPPPKTVRVPLSLAFSEGFLVRDQQRTHVGMEAEIGFRFAGALWLEPSLGLAWTVESPVNVTIRPGLRWYFGSFPMYVRTAVAAMVTPVQAWAFLAGLGGEVPLWDGGFLRLEVDWAVWSRSVVSMDFAVGVGHAF